MFKKGGQKHHEQNTPIQGGKTLLAEEILLSESLMYIYK